MGFTPLLGRLSEHGNIEHIRFFRIDDAGLCSQLEKKNSPSLAFNMSVRLMSVPAMSFYLLSYSLGPEVPPIVTQVTAFFSVLS